MKGQTGDSMFISILSEFLDGYSRCAIQAGTSAEKYQFSLGTLIEVMR